MSSGTTPHLGPRNPYRGREETQPGSRAQSAAGRLAHLIRESSPGERMGTKEDLRSLVNVSVGVFNETLRLLQAQGLVTVKPGPGGGIFVAEQSPMARLGNAVLGLDVDRATVAEAMRIRNNLEILIVEDAIEHSTTEGLSAMRDALGRMSSAVLANDGIGFLRANWRLHSCIAAASPNAMLHSMYTSLLDLVEEHTISVFPADGASLREFHAERYLVHAALVDAIAEGDSARAGQLVQEHNSGLASKRHPSRTDPSGAARTRAAALANGR